MDLLDNQHDRNAHLMALALDHIACPACADVAAYIGYAAADHASEWIAKLASFGQAVGRPVYLAVREASPGACLTVHKLYPRPSTLKLTQEQIGRVLDLALDRHRCPWERR